MQVAPTLSIIIPTFNRPVQLLRCVQSVLPQLSNNTELIVLDNCSDVSAHSLIDYTNVKVVTNGFNIGAVGNIMRALEISTGNWVWILGDDDIAAPDGIGIVLSVIANYSDAGHIFFSNSMGKITPTTIGRGVNFFTNNFNKERFGGLLWISSQIFNRKAVARNVRYAYAFPSSSPQLPLFLMTLETHPTLYHSSEIAIHGEPTPSEMWDIYGVLDQMTQLFSLPVNKSIKMHLAECLFYWGKDFNNHFLFIGLLHFIGNDPTGGSSFHFFIEYFLEQYFNFRNKLFLLIVLVRIDYEIGSFHKEMFDFIGC